MKRVTVYDWVRLLATVFVVIGHCTYLSMTSTYGGIAYGFPASAGDITASFPFVFSEKLRNFFYEFHMPLFFILSGSVLALKPLPSMKDFLFSKGKRLVIPYFLYGYLFMFPVKYLSGYYDTAGLLQAMKVFLIGEESGHLWFLTSLFWCMAAFLLIKKGLEKCGLDNDIFLLAASVVVYYGWKVFPFDILGLKLGLSYLLFFTLGYLFEGFRKKHDRFPLPYVLGALLVFSVIEYFHHYYQILDWFFGIIVASILTYLFAEIFDRLFPEASSNKVWQFVIRNLFPVYLFHDPLNYLIMKLAFSSPLVSTPAGCYIYLLLRSAGVFIISLLLGEAVGIVKRRWKKT